MGPELASWLMTSARRFPFSAHAHLPYGQAHLAQLDPSSHSCSAGFAPGVEDPALNCIFHQAGPAALLIRNMWLGSGAIDQPPFLYTMGAMGNLRDYHAYGLSLRPDSHAPPEPLGVTNIGGPCIAVSNTGRSRGWRERGVFPVADLWVRVVMGPCLSCDHSLPRSPTRARQARSITTGSLSSPAEVPKTPVCVVLVLVFDKLASLEARLARPRHDVPA